MRVQVSVVLAILLATGIAHSQSEAAPNPEPDGRYKVDILEVVGHPDDDIEVAAYVAKLIEEKHAHSKLTDAQYQELEAIISLGREGKWSGAEQETLRLAEAQRP